MKESERMDIYLDLARELTKLWIIKMQIYFSIPTRKLDLVLICKKKKKNLLFGRFCCYHGSESDNERKQKDGNIIGSCQRAEKAVEHKSDGDNSWSWCARKFPQGLEKRLEKLEIGERIKTIQTAALLRSVSIFFNSYYTDV